MIFLYFCWKSIVDSLVNRTVYDLFKLWTPVLMCNHIRAPNHVRSEHPSKMWLNVKTVVRDPNKSCRVHVQLSKMIFKIYVSHLKHVDNTPFEYVFRRKKLSEREKHKGHIFTYIYSFSLFAHTITSWYFFTFYCWTVKLPTIAPFGSNFSK